MRKLPSRMHRQRLQLLCLEKNANNTVASPNMLLSASRDKTLIIWDLTRDETSYGYPKRSLHGHSHIVSDCVRPNKPPSNHTTWFHEGKKEIED